ncbi:unnamed protein product [Notodromas monacha]|uniref:Uncharacterized protein n=1 Tax=Notodromas monacha TaxID=399045 RepID=A0A7R9G7I7_9CRUS|nr:unnamed protein product [Notodromas monacha]CAG0912260.1 unnamed protein product [Notodromas monacha]
MAREHAVDREQNNLQCDCRLDWIYEAYNTTASHFFRENLEQLKCYVAVEYLEDLLPHVALEDPAQAADPRSDHTDRYDDIWVYRTTTFSLGAHVRLLDLDKANLPCPTTHTTGFETETMGKSSTSSQGAKVSSPAPVAVSQTNHPKPKSNAANSAACQFFAIWLAMTLVAATRAL